MFKKFKKYIVLILLVTMTFQSIAPAYALSASPGMGRLDIVAQSGGDSFSRIKKYMKFDSKAFARSIGLSASLGFLTGAITAGMGSFVGSAASAATAGIGNALVQTIMRAIVKAILNAILQAIVGALKGLLTAAFTGGNIWEGVYKGALRGAVSGGFSALASGFAEGVVSNLDGSKFGEACFGAAAGALVGFGTGRIQGKLLWRIDGGTEEELEEYQKMGMIAGGISGAVSGAMAGIQSVKQTEEAAVARASGKPIEKQSFMEENFGKDAIYKNFLGYVFGTGAQITGEMTAMAIDKAVYKERRDELAEEEAFLKWKFRNKVMSEEEYFIAMRGENGDGGLLAEKEKLNEKAAMLNIFVSSSVGVVATVAYGLLASGVEKRGARKSAERAKERETQDTARNKADLKANEGSTEQQGDYEMVDNDGVKEKQFDAQGKPVMDEETGTQANREKSRGWGLKTDTNPVDGENLVEALVVAPAAAAGAVAGYAIAKKATARSYSHEHFKNWEDYYKERKSAKEYKQKTAELYNDASHDQALVQAMTETGAAVGAIVGQTVFRGVKRGGLAIKNRVRTRKYGDAANVNLEYDGKGGDPKVVVEGQTREKAKLERNEDGEIDRVTFMEDGKKQTVYVMNSEEATEAVDAAAPNQEGKIILKGRTKSTAVEQDTGGIKPGAPVLAEHDGQGRHIKKNGNKGDDGLRDDESVEAGPGSSSFNGRPTIGQVENAGGATFLRGLGSDFFNGLTSERTLTSLTKTWAGFAMTKALETDDYQYVEEAGAVEGTGEVKEVPLDPTLDPTLQVLRSQAITVVSELAGVPVSSGLKALAVATHGTIGGKFVPYVSLADKYEFSKEIYTTEMTHEQNEIKDAMDDCQKKKTDVACRTMKKVLVDAYVANTTTDDSTQEERNSARTAAEEEVDKMVAFAQKGDTTFLLGTNVVGKTEEEQTEILEQGVENMAEGAIVTSTILSVIPKPTRADTEEETAQQANNERRRNAVEKIVVDWIKGGRNEETSDATLQNIYKKLDLNDVDTDTNREKARKKSKRDQIQTFLLKKAQGVEDVIREDVQGERRYKGRRKHGQINHAKTNKKLKEKLWDSFVQKTGIETVSQNFDTYRAKSVGADDLIKDTRKKLGARGLLRGMAVDMGRQSLSVVGHVTAGTAAGLASAGMKMAGPNKLLKEREYNYLGVETMDSRMQGASEYSDLYDLGYMTGTILTSDSAEETGMRVLEHQFQKPLINSNENWDETIDWTYVTNTMMIPALHGLLAFRRDKDHGIISEDALIDARKKMGDRSAYKREAAHIDFADRFFIGIGSAQEETLTGLFRSAGMSGTAPTVHASDYNSLMNKGRLRDNILMGNRRALDRLYSNVGKNHALGAATTSKYIAKAFNMKQNYLTRTDYEIDRRVDLFYDASGSKRRKREKQELAQLDAEVKASQEQVEIQNNRLENLPKEESAPAPDPTPDELDAISNQGTLAQSDLNEVDEGIVYASNTHTQSEPTGDAEENEAMGSGVRSVVDDRGAVAKAAEDARYNAEAARYDRHAYEVIDSKEDAFGKKSKDGIVWASVNPYAVGKDNMIMQKTGGFRSRSLRATDYDLRRRRDMTLYHGIEENLSTMYLGGYITVDKQEGPEGEYLFHVPGIEEGFDSYEDAITLIEKAHIETVQNSDGTEFYRARKGYRAFNEEYDDRESALHASVVGELEESLVVPVMEDGKVIGFISRNDPELKGENPDMNKVKLYRAHGEFTLDQALTLALHDSAVAEPIANQVDYMDKIKVDDVPQYRHKPKNVFTATATKKEHDTYEQAAIDAYKAENSHVAGNGQFIIVDQGSLADLRESSELSEIEFEIYGEDNQDQDDYLAGQDFDQAIGVAPADPIEADSQPVEPVQAQEAPEPIIVDPNSGLAIMLSPDVTDGLASTDKNKQKEALDQITAIRELEEGNNWNPSLEQQYRSIERQVGAGSSAETQAQPSGPEQTEDAQAEPITVDPNSDIGILLAPDVTGGLASTDKKKQKGALKRIRELRELEQGRNWNDSLEQQYRSIESQVESGSSADLQEAQDASLFDEGSRAVNRKAYKENKHFNKYLKGKDTTAKETAKETAFLDDYIQSEPEVTPAQSVDTTQLNSNLVDLNGMSDEDALEHSIEQGWLAPNATVDDLQGLYLGMPSDHDPNDIGPDVVDSDDALFDDGARTISQSPIDNYLSSVDETRTIDQSPIDSYLNPDDPTMWSSEELFDYYLDRAPGNNQELYIKDGNGQTFIIDRGSDFSVQRDAVSTDLILNYEGNAIHSPSFLSENEW